ncbi:hypothetical protein AYI69_g7400 [Smittium culicis]|uniref:Uncharacterized protein n=1 Tax=Smittium culicis TaxID=133412 RepID=A0A1R1XSA3_9FUNG|nr:hypothetical protein AYI69_g7400 [Smittium culicis]
MPKKIVLGASIAKKAPQSDRRNKGVENRNKLDIESSQQNIPKTNAYSKAQLLKKSKIYEKLTKSSLDVDSFAADNNHSVHDDQTAKILAESSVDFQFKSLSNLLSKRNRSDSENSSDSDDSQTSSQVNSSLIITTSSVYTTLY